MSHRKRIDAGARWPKWAQTPLDAELPSFVEKITFIVRMHWADGAPADTVLQQVIEDAEWALTARGPAELVTPCSDMAAEEYGGVCIAPAAIYRMALDGDGFEGTDERAIERVVCLARRVAEAELARLCGDS